MHLTQRILGFTLLGSEWVLWVLIGLSVLSVAVMVERAHLLRRPGATAARSGAAARAPPGRRPGGRAPAARGAAGPRRRRRRRRARASFDRGADAVSETMAGAKARLRLELERHLGILGTLGNNAPFIGLFGTVLGIIKAFADLAHNQAGGAGAVMSGISEALVATAVGLLVAIPAVIAFNIFQGRVREAMAEIDAMAHLVLSTIPRATDAPNRREPGADANMARANNFGSGDDDAGPMIVNINVTPLVDITLVLLIIFMVTASYIVSPAIRVDLPKAASGTEQQRTSLGLTLTRDGRPLPERRAQQRRGRHALHRRRAAAQSGPPGNDRRRSGRPPRRRRASHRHRQARRRPPLRPQRRPGRSPCPMTPEPLRSAPIQHLRLGL